MSEMKLKPCPNPWCTDGNLAIRAMSRGPAYVACACGVCGPTVGWETGENEARLLAVAAWNTRSDPVRDEIYKALRGDRYFLAALLDAKFSNEALPALIRERIAKVDAALAKAVPHD